MKRTRKQNISADVEHVLKADDLTERQRLFCLYYVRSFNATRSYQKAFECGYDVARVEGCKLMKNPSIRKELHSLQKSRFTRVLLDEHDIFQKYMDIAFADITDYVEFGREMVQVQGTDKLREVNRVKLKNSSGVDGTLIAEVKQGREGVAIKLIDRMKALDWLAEHMDMATAEQRARIDQMKANTERLQHNPEVSDDDGVTIINDMQ